MLLKDVLKDIKSRQIITSRGTPTVEVEFCLNGFSLFSSVPSGKSVGFYEAKNIVDHQSSYNGTSVYKVIENINKHKKAILYLEIVSPDLFDAFLITLDGTKDKSTLGANFILPISICYRKLLAYLNKQPLWKQLMSEALPNKENLNKNMPLAHFNVINGGVHSGNKLDCQEIMVCFPEYSFHMQLERSIEFFNALGIEITEKYDRIYTSAGDEGGYVPPIETLKEALDLIVSTGKKVNSSYKIALDLAANSFYQDGIYSFENQKMTGKELAHFYEKLLNEYPIHSIEDPFAESDIESWKYFYQKAKDLVNIVADDLTVTNTELIKKFGENQMFNTVLIKPNQIGSILETIEAVKLCKQMGFKTMISHRSSETEDTFISSLSVGVGADYIKAGAPNHGERLCKYNELLRIEESLKEQ